MLEIPSKVNDRKFIRMPEQEKFMESDEEWSRCGKWILLNTSGRMSWIDETWIKLQVLQQKGSLILIKASTAATSHTLEYPRVILCYTKSREEEIERAAKEIRDVIHYEDPLYYKSNDLTENKIDVRSGHHNIANYMYTTKGYFYKKNLNCWILVSGPAFDNLRRHSVEFDINNFADIDFDQLPSRSRKIPLTMESANKNLQRRICHVCFLITCSLEEEVNILCEADRMWIVGKKLINEGAIYKVTCKKNPTSAELRFYFCRKLNIKSSVVCDLCEKLYMQAQVFDFFYISIGNLRYRYSPEKEIVFLPNYYGKF